MDNHDCDNSYGWVAIAVLRMGGIAMALEGSHACGYCYAWVFRSRVAMAMATIVMAMGGCIAMAKVLAMVMAIGG